MKVDVPGKGTETGAPIEYRSIQMVMDHLQMRDDGHEVQKFVMSTETQLESLASLAVYYNLQHAIATPAALATIQQMTEEQAPILILKTPENTQVLLDLDDWAALSELFPTQYALCDFLAKSVSTAYANAINTQGAIPVLLMFGFNLEAADAAVAGEDPQASR